MFIWQSIFIGVAAFLSQIGHVTSHGMLIQPAQRSSAWRFGYKNPENYDDNQLFCGGKSVQWNSENKGRCGVCGDPYNAEEKPNEDVDGKYVKNDIITGSYLNGSVMATKVKITADHKGWFEFRLCPLATIKTKVTQACLNQTVLTVADTNITRIYLDDIRNGTGAANYDINLQLPSNITCERCVLQWRYNTGNSWGCEPGKCCLGCGEQENFVNCADIKIFASTGTSSTTQSSSSASQSATMSVLSTSSTLRSSTYSSATSISTKSSTSTLSNTATSQLRDTSTSSTASVSTSSSDSASSSTSSSRSSSTSIPPSSSTSNSPSSSTTDSPSSSASVTPSSSTSDSQSSSTSGSQSTASSGNSFQCSSTLTCSAAGAYMNNPGISKWCCDNCPGNCPSTHCSCTINYSGQPTSDSQSSSTSSSTSGSQTTTSGNTNIQCSSTLTCSAVGAFANNQGMGQWCCDNCQFNCPTTHCSCTNTNN